MIKSKFKVVTLFMSSVLLVACQTNKISDQAIQITGAELKALYSGNTVYGNFPNKEAWSEYYAEDGRVAYVHKKNVEFGVWHTTHSEICTRYITEKADDEYCWAVFKEGELYALAWPSGSKVGEIIARFDRVASGDVENLIE